MAEQTTLTYEVSAGSGTLTVNSVASDIDYISFQVDGDGSVDGAVTVKLQEANTASGTFKDVSGASATVNTSTSEYIDGGKTNASFFQFDVAVGAATAGTITFTLTYK